MEPPRPSPDDFPHVGVLEAEGHPLGLRRVGLLPLAHEAEHGQGVVPLLVPPPTREPPGEGLHLDFVDDTRGRGQAQDVGVGPVRVEEALGDPHHFGRGAETDDAGFGRGRHVARMFTIASLNDGYPLPVPWATATSSSSSSRPSRNASNTSPTPTMPKAWSSAARSAPMLALP